jgi:hypothetical protein
MNSTFTQAQCLRFVCIICLSLARLKAVDTSLLLLYAVAYVCNVVLTPLDDSFTYEYQRLPTFHQQQLPPAFMRRVSVWHALNLLRLAATGLAWGLVCYRSSQHVVAELIRERGEREAAEGAAAGGGGGGGYGGSRGVQGVQHQVLRGAQRVGGGLQSRGAVPAAAAVD